MTLKNDLIIENYCNYCSEDINLYTEQVGLCVNNTLEINNYYVDWNYLTCCSETNLSSDCNINNGSYFNFTTYGNCSNLDCLYNNEPFLKSKIPYLTKKGEDRIYWICDLTDIEVESCLSYVYKDDVLLQTNPDIEYIEGIGEVAYFESINNEYVKPYFTKKNLLPDEEFTFTVKCIGNNINTFSTLIKPTYKNLDIIASRGVWFKGNMVYVIGFFVVLIFIIILWWIIK